MPDDVPLTFRCLDTAGGLVLDCTHEAGYEVVSLEPVERRWRRAVVTAEDVEGHVEVQRVLDSAVIGAVIRVRGATTLQAATRRENLLNAVEARAWRLQISIDGDVETWRADAADSSTVREWVDVHHQFRTVTLRVPVQPRTVEEQPIEGTYRTDANDPAPAAIATTSLAAPATTDDTTILVADSAGLPTSFPYKLILGYGTETQETVLVTDASGDLLTVTRAQDGTTAASHDEATTVSFIDPSATPLAYNAFATPGPLTFDANGVATGTENVDNTGFSTETGEPQ